MFTDRRSAHAEEPRNSCSADAAFYDRTIAEVFSPCYLIWQTPASADIRNTLGNATDMNREALLAVSNRVFAGS
jgi:hypothetical protein